MCVGSTDSIPHATLASTPQSWEGCMPSGRHPDPTERPLLELEVRICGRWDSWVRVPAHCQLPECWANISGIKRSAACPAGPTGAGGCRVLRLRYLCQVLGAPGKGESPRTQDRRWLEFLEEDSMLWFWPPEDWTAKQTPSVTPECSVTLLYFFFFFFCFS